MIYMFKQLIAGLALATLAIPQSVSASPKGECYTTHGKTTVCAVRHGDSNFYSIAAYNADKSSHPAVIIVNCDGSREPRVLGFSDWESADAVAQGRAFCLDLQGESYSPGTVLS